MSDNASLPFVELCEVGPRDGFQFETTPIPTGFKVASMQRMLDAGLRRIQATSFVHPGRVPQMADADSVLAALPRDERITALALNLRGVDRAIEAGVTTVDLSIALNEQHAADNANTTVEAGVRAAEEMISRARGAGLRVQLGLQTVWGYASPDDTPRALIESVVERFAQSDLESLSLADSTGMASPKSIRSVLDSVGARVGDIPLVLHLHDTRGLGLANVVAALEAGVRRFDTSLGGLGGCPFIPGATGNVATEDVAYLCERMGYDTGIDIVQVAAVSRDVEALVGRPLSGKMYRLVAQA
ncbi:MAG: hydroxymethylglutaryl-CoA lyase [Rhodothermales bacterium]|nr:hydroxymethylglutaryl-CoA lyase [Rhodothermales bacterium]